jgi:DNA segregation ATPase FtsK/SpoIIIE-like protein
MSKDLLAQAATAVITTQTGAAWLLMQELDIDFTDATRLLDELGRLGIIGPHAGGGRHDVLYRPSELGQAIELIEKEQ